MNSRELRDDLEKIAGYRVFFGHQSVGRNILQGVSELSAEAGVSLSVIRVDEKAAVATKGIVHTDIGRNNDPQGKVVAFSNFLGLGGASSYDMAILKFCYVDLSAEGMKDPLVLLDEYSRAVSKLRAVRPNMRIVHVTVPLRSDPLEWKTPVKRLLGLETYEDADNHLRNLYNNELRKRFVGEVIFDIAAIESTRPDGSRSMFLDGRENVYTLAKEYTSDGGHLNALGRRVAASAFIRTVARALGPER